MDMRSFDLGSVEKAVLNSLLSGASVQTVFDEVHAASSLPIIAFDVTFNLIAYSFERPFYIPNWERLANDRYAPEELVLYNNYLDMEENHTNSRTSLIVNTANSSSLKTAFGPILDGDRLLGYCAAVLEDCDPETVLATNDLLCRAVSYILTEGMEHMSASEMLSLLLNEEEDPRAAAHRTAFTSFAPGPYAIVRLDSGSTGSATTNYLCNSVNERHDECIAAKDKDTSLYVLICGVKDSAVLERSLNKINTLAEKYNYTGAVSDTFFGLDRLRDAKMQAAAGAKLQALVPRQRIISFREHVAECFCLPALEDGTQSVRRLRFLPRILSAPGAETLLHTLEVYLASSQRTAQAAAVLGIHKNTVAYRIRKIQELIGAGVSERAVSERLLLELSLYRLDERRRRRHAD